MLVKARPNLHQPLSDGRTHPRLTVGKVYVVTGSGSQDVQLVNDEGEPIQVERFLFDVLDIWIPRDWVTRFDDEDGSVEWRGPPECAEPGFFEDWHDGRLAARQLFAEVYRKLWLHYAEQLANQTMVLKLR